MAAQRKNAADNRKVNADHQWLDDCGQTDTWVGIEWRDAQAPQRVEEGPEKVAASASMPLGFASSLS